MLKLINRTLDLIIDYVLPLFVIVCIIGAIFIVPMVIHEQSQMNAEVESCVLEHREEDPYCRLLILKYTRKQNQTTVMPVPVVIPHR
jgi:cell division protein FtsL